MVGTVDKTRIGVIFGGRSGEHEVSLMSARSVLSVLDRSKYEIVPIGITHEGTWLTGEGGLEAFQNGQTEGMTRVTLLPYPGDRWLYAIRQDAGAQSLEKLVRLDVVFPVLHGSFGEDGTLQGFLELADLAYVGAGVLGSAVGMDKGLFKDVMRTHGVPVLNSIIVNRSQVETDRSTVITAIEKMSAYPIFTKPANLGSSVGVTKCRNRSDLLEGLMDAARFDRRVLVEQGLNNPREIEISVLGNDEPVVSLPGEIIPSDDFYSYQAKYLDDRTQLIIPAHLEGSLVARIQEIALKAFRAVDCSGMARVDFLLDPAANEVYVSEINTIPGFTKISMYPKLWEASGLNFSALVDRLVVLALERKSSRDRTERRFESRGRA
jgi:D-alanine-D-alanine ligase